MRIMDRANCIRFVQIVALSAFIHAVCNYQGVQAAQSVQNYPKLTGVQLLAPLNLKISPGSNYSFVVSADQQVLDAVKTTVSNGILNIDTKGSFETQQVVNAVVYLPKDALQQVTTSSMVAVDNGFSVQSFSATLTGTATLFLRSITAKSLQVQGSGVPTAYIAGNIGSVSLTGSGNSNFYISGTTDSIDLSFSGLANIISDVTSDDLVITGVVPFPGHVTYTHGSCEMGQAGLQSGNSRHAGLFNWAGSLLGSSCQQANSVTIPALQPDFTCGLNVTEPAPNSNSNGQSFSTKNVNGQAWSSTTASNNGQNNVNIGNNNVYSSSNSGNSGSFGTTGSGSSFLAQSLPCKTQGSISMF